MKNEMTGQAQKQLFRDAQHCTYPIRRFMHNRSSYLGRAAVINENAAIAGEIVMLVLVGEYANARHASCSVMVGLSAHAPRHEFSNLRLRGCVMCARCASCVYIAWGKAVMGNGIDNQTRMSPV